jgi:hypothetical protein
MTDKSIFDDLKTAKEKQIGGSHYKKHYDSTLYIYNKKQSLFFSRERDKICL